MHVLFHTHPEWARTWLWRARNETLLSIASRDLAHSLATCEEREREEVEHMGGGGGGGGGRDRGGGE